jgi:hypothetical protein|tara:strand:+ start:2520 stop:2858 length:339 start_codon:yes stop_codon:yes gene_type:complete
MDILSKYENILGSSTKVLLQIGDKFDSYKARAKTRNMDFKLSFSQFDALVKGDCHYCKVPVKDKPMGIDRVDSKKGYILSNSVPCCWTCNRAKSDMNYVDFKNYLKRFYEMR